MFADIDILWFIGSFALSLIIGLIFVIFRTVTSAKKKKEAPKTPEEQEKSTTKKEKKKEDVVYQAKKQEFRKSFSIANRILKSTVSGRDYHKQVPLFLMLGPPKSGKTTLLQNTGLNMPMRRFEGNLSQKKSIETLRWSFFDKGVVLDPDGRLIQGLHGKENDEKGWKLFLKYLHRFRSSRPINGVILSLPCEELLPKEKEEIEETKARIQELSTILYEKLWQTQRQLGVYFPVYILVTKTDQLSGFESFAQELSITQSNEIFGWSNPYSLETAYSEDWLGDAQTQLENQLTQIQLELFAEKPSISESDGLFLFPAELHKLFPMLSIFVNGLFKESIYHDSFFFRGVYFTGSVQEKSEDLPNPLFLRHLFEKKIFPEKGLAKPAYNAFNSNSRKIRIAQASMLAFFLLGGGGMWRTHYLLNEEKEKMLPVLNLIGNSLVEIQNKQTVDRNLFEQQALHLLEGMTKIDPSELNSFALPSSWYWFTDTPEKINRSTALAYEHIIIRMMNIELQNRARTLGYEKKVATGASKEIKEVGITPIEETPEYKELNQFIKEVQELEKILNLFNNELIKGQAKSEEFVSVVIYLYGIDPKTEFSPEALNNLKGEAIDVSILESNVTTKIYTLIQSLQVRLIHYNPLVKQLEDLAVELQGIQVKQSSGVRTTSNIERFRKILKMLNETEKVLSRSEFSWMGKSSFGLGAGYEEIVSSIKNSKILGPQVSQEIQKRFEKDYKELQLLLSSYKTRVTGQILQHESSIPQMNFSKGIINLKVSLEDYFSLQFTNVPEEESKLRTTIPAGKRLIWNTALLEQTVKLFEPYQQFLNERLKNFPTGLQYLFANISRDGFQANVTDMLSRAQGFEEKQQGSNSSFLKEELRGEIINFKKSVVHLNKILQLLEDLGFTKTNQQLFRVVATQAGAQLASSNRILKNEELYLVREGDFSWWDGAGKVSLSGYQVHDIEELRIFLLRQKERVQFLSEELAKPLINFLGYKNLHRGYVNESMVKRWQQISLSLEDYEKQKPGNSLDVLEEFVLSGMDNLVTSDCVSGKAPLDLMSRSNNFFIQRRNDLRRKLFFRCQDLNLHQTYNEF